MRKLLSGIAILGLAFSGCATEGGLTERETGALAGAGLGAATGAIIGNQTGHAGAGTAIGAGLGALGGALAGEGMWLPEQVPSLGSRVHVATPDRQILNGCFR